MPGPSLPILGASLSCSLLDDHAEWLVSEQRDLEIPDVASNPSLLDGDIPALAASVRATLAGYEGRIGIHAPYEGLPLLTRDPRLQSLATDRLCQALDFVEGIGGSHMVVHSPFLFFGANPFVAHSATNGRDGQIALVHKVLDPVVARAEEIDCTIVIEGIHDRHPDPLLALVRSFDSDFVRMGLDIGHAFITHRLGGPPVDQWVREAGPVLGHLHLQDTDGDIDRHWVPGTGRMNWHALFDALAEQSHNPRLILELKQSHRVREGAAWLQSQGLAR